MRGKTAKSGRHTVAVVIADGLSPFEFGVTCEVFGYDRSELGVPWYRFVVCAAEPPRVVTEMGFTLDTRYGLDALKRADTIIVPPTDTDPSTAVIDALRAAHSRGTRLVSLCTGTFTLAAAGLLDGRPATTHWRHAAEFTAKFPLVKLDPSVLYVDDGQILTSAGTAGSIDLCLYLVRLDFGAEVANAVARRMVVPPQRHGGQAQYIEAPIQPTDAQTADLFSETLTWIQGHLDEAVTIDDLAHRAAMSPRTFSRRFRHTTGTTPYQWLLHQRILLAQRLLETTDLPLDVIGFQCGIATTASLREHFQRVVGTSPSAYRRTFSRL